MKKDKTVSGSLIHVKLEYSDAVDSKKDFLSSEISLLKTASSIKRYSILRLEELKIKNRLAGKIRELKLTASRLHQVMPQIKISKSENVKNKEDKSFELNKKYFKDDLEYELQEIQRQLMDLERKN